MRKTLTAVVAALLLILAPAAAHAKAPEFDVTTEGITLHHPHTFGNQHAIHLDYYDTGGYLQQVRGNTLQGPQDGTHVSWAALGVQDGSIITYVHVTGHGKVDGEWTFGKGITPGPAPTPETETRSEHETRWEAEQQCPTDEGTYGHVIERENKYRIDFERTQTVTWNADTLTWDTTWGDWTVTGEQLVETITERTRLMTDAEAEACGLPATGAPLTAAAGMALVLVLAGAGLAVARRRTAVQR